jgi:ACS family hexuronate transporter-like MFS transporter
MALIAHLVLYLTEVLLFGVVAAGGLLAMTEVAGAIARPGAGLLSDRVFGGALCVLLLVFVRESKRKI